MSKILKDAALIVGVVAIGVATAGVGAFGAAAAAAAASAASAVGVASAAALAADLSLAAAALTVVSGLTAKKPGNTGNPMSWTADPQAGIPYIMGRTYAGGQIVYRRTYQKDDKAERIHTVYSAGPITSFDTFYVDGIATTISGDTAEINDRGKMLVGTQRGQQPEAVQFGGMDAPDITAASKLSGLAASSITLFYDAKGGTTFTTEPQCGWVIHGVTAYDPRLDSTYPGGNGPQRIGDETTWAYSANPYLHALTWLIGRRQNGKLMMGVGVPTSGILIDQYVEGANVADANKWTISGELSSVDDKWSRLKDMLQAGGGEPIRLGAQIGCIINTPRVSLATITADDVVGDASVQATQAKRDRINAIVPRYTAEQSVTTEKSDGSGLQTAVTWAVTAGSPVIVADYVAFDGKPRQKEVDYTFVADLTQSQQLARYDIENAREFGPITLPMKLRWMGYKPGDVVTAVLPELGLNGQDILLLQRELSPADGTVTMTARSETAAKHAFALGQTGTAPATPSVTGPALVSTPDPSAWTLTGGTVSSANGTTVAALIVTGSADSDAIDAILIQYRTSATQTAQPGPWIDAGAQAPSLEHFAITSVQDQTAYDVAIAYRRGPNIGTPLILGPAVAGQTSVPWEAGVSDPNKTKPDNNATKGAPTGTIVSDRNAELVVSSIDLNASDILQQGLRGDAMQLLIDARTLINGAPVSSVVKTLQQAATDGDQAYALNFTLLGARSNDNQSWVLNLDTVVDSNGQSLAERFSTITASNSDITTTVNTLAQVYVNSDGTAKALYTLETSAVGTNGLKAISGFTNAVDGTGSSTFDILASHFSIVDPNSGTPYTVFDITNGVVRMHTVEVDTIKPGSVSGAARVIPSGTISGNGGWQTAATLSVTLTADATIDVFFNAGQGYSAGVKDWGLRLKVDGTIVKSFDFGGNRTGFTETLNMIRAAVTLSAGATHTIVAEWAGADSTIVLGNIDMTTNWRFA